MYWKPSDTFKLIFSLAISGLAGAVGTLFTISAIPTWYAWLAKPAIAPPNWIFGPVWTTLYILMGIAAFLVWRKARPRTARWKLGIFDVQLILNALWSFIFFGAHNLVGAFIEIIVLWIAILATIIAFARVSRTAAWLLAPYLAWVTFAAYLSWSIWSLNG